MGMCVDACEASGVLGELLAFALIGARLVYAEVKRRKLVGEKKAIVKERDELKDHVVQMSLRPGVPERSAMPSLTELQRQIGHASIVEPSLSPPERDRTQE